MSINTANLQANTNDPRLARADINDMFNDIGYGTTDTVSPITTTGEASKLFKFSAIANTILHFLRIRKSSTTALNVQDDSSSTVFNVDTTNGIVSAKQFAVSALNTAPASPTATGTAGDIRITAEGLYIANGINSWAGGLRSYFRTSIMNNGGGTAIFSSFVSTSPQFGRLIAYDMTDSTKFCIYNLYKANSTSTVQFSLVMNNVLAISAVNVSGTIALNDTSANIKMAATRELIAG